MIISQQMLTSDENSGGLASSHDRLTVSDRLLSGKRPVRHLSQILIVILMLISPLSFSTDKIPNFAYECPVSTTCSIKSNATTPICEGIAPATAPEAVVSVLPHGAPATITPCFELICSSSPCRAPPC